MRAVLVLFCFVLSLVQGAFGQKNLQPVPGFPAQQVYDLLVDQKGYLWIGHELGITRYDGLSFTQFSNPNEASLGVTGLIEDRFGRIWCHNFSSQIFYIENERMHWLKQYDFEKENQFPNMVLLGDELVVSSTQGLFICNVATMKTRYIRTLNGKAFQVNYVTLLGNQVMAYNVGVPEVPRGFYIYDAARGLRQLKWNVEDLRRFAYLRYWALQPYAFRDTIYATGDPTGLLLKIMVRRDSVVVVDTTHTQDFINVVTRDGETVWVHTRSKSFSNKGSTIENRNVSDVVSNRYGNTWVSSIKQGLLMEQKPPAAVPVPVEGLVGDDFIRSITMGETTIVLGTQNGKLIVLDKATYKTLYTYTVPFKTSAIGIVRLLKDDLYFFNTSMRPYILDARSRKAEPMEVGVLVKEVDIKKDILFLATLSGLMVHPSPLNKGGIEWQRGIDNILRSVEYEREGNNLIFLKRGRNDAVVYDEKAQSILASFKDGVYELSPAGVKPLEIWGNRVYASSLEYGRDKLLVATISNGLFIRSGKKITHLTINEGLSSNSIIDTKVVGNHLWLFQSNAIQVLDIDSETILSEIDLPAVVGSTMLDVVVANDTALITSMEGMFKVPLKVAPARYPIRSYLTYVLANNKDTLLGDHARLSFNENDLQIYLSAPWFNSSQPVFFKYRLVGSGDEAWHITKEPVVRFPSLMPGSYRFEAFAMHPSGKRAENTVYFRFEVARPWWEQWWLRILVLVGVGALSYGAYRYRVNQILKVENIRRSISSDLHDDIGATLSSINIYTELAKRQEDNKEFLNLIQENTREIIGKLDDLVWSINPKNDSCEQLINRMRSFSEPLLAGANINYKITCSEDLHRLKLNTGLKRNVYLIFKETINNVVKHSRSKNCTINIYYHNKRLYIQIADDGIGFDESHYAKNRNGLKNLHDRARQIKAHLKIDSVKNKGTRVQLEAEV